MGGLRPRLVVLLVLAGACGEAEPADGGADAGVDAGGVTDAATAPAPHLEVGTGGECFLHLARGDTLGLYRGKQGSQHVLVSVRIRGIEPVGVIVNLVVRRRRDGQPVSVPYAARLPFDPGPEEGTFDRTGIPLIFEEPAEALGEPLLLSAEALDTAGRTARSGVVIAVAWREDLPKPEPPCPADT